MKFSLKLKAVESHISNREQNSRTMSTSEKDEVDWKLDLFIYFIIIFYGIAGIFLCFYLWPMIKDIWRSYYPEKKPKTPMEKKTE